MMQKWSEGTSGVKPPIKRKSWVSPTLRLLIATVCARIPKSLQTGFLAALLFNLIHPVCAMAEENKALRPVFYIENQNLARFASAVGYVFSIENETAYLEQNADQANFVSSRFLD